jgi:hypothetical protein
VVIWKYDMAKQPDIDRSNLGGDGKRPPWVPHGPAAGDPWTHDRPFFGLTFETVQMVDMKSILPTGGPSLGDVLPSVNYYVYGHRFYICLIGRTKVGKTIDRDRKVTLGDKKVVRR